MEMNIAEKSFKIFGLGLSKTGTSSLADALNELGFPTIHYPFDIVLTMNYGKEIITFQS
jgi:hypothetical protein